MLQRKGLDTLKCHEIKWTLLQAARLFSPRVGEEEHPTLPVTAEMGW